MELAVIDDHNRLAGSGGFRLRVAGEAASLGFHHDLVVDAELALGHACEAEFGNLK